MSVVRKIDDDDEEYTHARRTIEKLRSLPNDWDGDGAPAVSKAAIDRALIVVSMLRGDPRIEAPQVAAMPDGGVELSWRRVTRKGRLEVEVRLTDEGDELMIGYAHVLGFEVDEPVAQPEDIARRVRERLTTERA